ncbi:LRRC45, partial [Symbiodinium sp. CCMP2456]
DSTALSLAYASVGDDGCTAIARYMRENVMLRTLDLRGNNIRADGLVVLAHGLRTGGGNMTSVCFKWNQIGSHPRGIQAFCDVLKENQSITHVDLRNNKIGTDCGPFLGDMLRENCTLTHLDLSWNDLGIEGGKALLDGLQAGKAEMKQQQQKSMNRIPEVFSREHFPAGACDVTFAGSGLAHGFAHVPDVGARSHNAGLARLRQHHAGLTWLWHDRTFDEDGSTLVAMGRSLNMTIASEGGMGPTSPKEGPPTTSLPPLTPAKVQPPVHDEEPALAAAKVAEYIDLLQLDVARNKKYRMDAEDWEMVPVVAGVIGFDGSFPSRHETFMLMHPLMLKSAQFLFGGIGDGKPDMLRIRPTRWGHLHARRSRGLLVQERERVVTKGFMEREMRYAQEMRELENLLARAKAEKASRAYSCGVMVVVVVFFVAHQGCSWDKA